MRILVVDDDDIALDMLEMTLQTDGHEVLRASNGHEALQILDSERVSLVISDWMMPGMHGLELVSQIRSRYASRYVYVILLTARSEKDDIVRGLNAGADDFVPKPFDPVELKLRVKVGQRILALETSQVTVFALAKLADTRDTDTGMHLERMREFSRILAQHITGLPEFQGKLSADYAEMIYTTSPLHDIGKVGVPDCVLLKPGRLDDEEFRIMKSHTTLGGQTFAAALQQFHDVEYLRMAHQIARYHHERYDGKGYPDGKSGMDIPLCARIVSVADVYDALISARAYKRAFTHEIARSMIIEDRGTKFDPIVVDAFLACEAKIKAAAVRLQDDESNSEAA